MKFLNCTKRTLQSICLLLLLNGCAGDDFPEEGVDGNEANNAANADENENGEGNENGNGNGNETGFNNENSNNENGNFADENLGNENNNGNNLLNNTGGENAPANEFVNNAAGDDFLSNNAAQPPANAAVEENSTEDLGMGTGNAIVGGNEVPNAEIAPPNANVGATDTSLAPSNGSSKPNKNGKVHYVLQNGSSAYDKPDGTVVKTYEQGDHPVVTAEGEWLQTSDGMFVPSATLTTRPIPRAKSVKSWR